MKSRHLEPRYFRRAPCRQPKLQGGNTLNALVAWVSLDDIEIRQFDQQILCTSCCI